MPGHRDGHRGWRGPRKNHSAGLASTARETALSLPADSPVLTLFRDASVKLKDRHDRHERIVKLSRDITIESKRIIFLLHSGIKPEEKEKNISEAATRLNQLITGPIKNAGVELQNSSRYLHAKAISPGLQEFIEAKTFQHLLEHGVLTTCGKVQNEFTYSIKQKSDAESEESDVIVETLLPMTDFLLGIADLTGELMRRAINSISSGDSEECFVSCQIVRDLYTGFLSISGGGRELIRKMSMIRGNVSKVEAAVYALRVRGGEAPPALLLPVAPPSMSAGDDGNDSDEGYF